jgi:aryl-alcohol dehydrogenase-like predicted oxidoreductase
MRYRLLGNTGLRVSELFLGGTIFTTDPSVNPAELPGILDAYQAVGGNVIDTARGYGDSEEVLGALLEGSRDRWVLATKYTMSLDNDDPNAAGNHRKSLRLSLEQSLRSLRTDYIDLLWVQVWDRHTPIEETMRALDDVVRAGKVLYVGLSDAPAWLAARANTLAEWHGWSPFAALQVPYNLLWRDAERELLPMAEAMGLSVAVWRPLAEGRLALPGGSGPDTPVVRVLHEVARELGASAAQVAIAWTRAHSPRVHPIVAATTVEHLVDDLAAAVLDLPDEAVERLEAAVPFDVGFPSAFIAQCERDGGVFGEANTRLVGQAPLRRC